MNAESVRRAIEVAREAASMASEYKSETYASVLLAQLLHAEQGIGSRPSALTLPSAPRVMGASVTGKPYSASELFAQKLWGSDPEKALLAGYFAEQHMAIQGFTVEDFRGILVSAKVPVPSNASLAIFKAVQRGWLMELPEKREGKKCFVLTQTGEHKVQEMDKPSQ